MELRIWIRSFFLKLSWCKLGIEEKQLCSSFIFKVHFYHQNYVIAFDQKEAWVCTLCFLLFTISELCNVYKEDWLAILSNAWLADWRSCESVKLQSQLIPNYCWYWYSTHWALDQKMRTGAFCCKTGSCNEGFLTVFTAQNTH